MLKRLKTARALKVGLTLLALFSFLIITSGSAFSHPPITYKNADPGQYYMDKNKDGICDNYGMRMGLKSPTKKGKGYGPGKGTGNLGERPKEGTGYGAKNYCPLRIKK
jgi:hypothetical protein